MSLDTEQLFQDGMELARQGQIAQALEKFDKVTENFQSRQGIPDWIVRLCEISFCLSEEGKNTEAAVVLQRAADSAEKLIPFSDDFKHFQTFFFTLWKTSCVIGKLDDANRWEKMVILEAEKKYNPHYRCNLFIIMGDSLVSQGRIKDAEGFFRRAAAEALKVSNWVARCHAYCFLGVILSLQGSYGEAESWLRRAAEEEARHDFNSLCRTVVFRVLKDSLRKNGSNQVGEKWVQETLGELERKDEHLTRCRELMIRAISAINESDLKSSAEFLEQAQTQLMEGLYPNRWPVAVSALMEKFNELFRMGLRVADRISKFHNGNLDALWRGLTFADGAKCVAIREGLRRYGRRDTGKEPAVPWRSAPPNRAVRSWRLPAARSNLLSVHREVRGLQSNVVGSTDDPVESFLEFPGEIDETKGEYCQPVDRAAVKRLLPDRNTVLVVFFFDGDDLVILPIRKDAGDEPEIRHTSGGGYFRVSKALPDLQALVHKQEGHILAIVEESLGLCGLPADELRCQADMTDIYRDLYKLLNLKGLLELIEKNSKRRADLHLVLIPDGPLYKLAMHAACASTTSPRLYQQFASLRYGLSLRTLELQQQIQDRRTEVEAKDRILRGVAFANPDREERIHLIDGVIREMDILVEETDSVNWWLHREEGPLDQQATRANLRERHRAGNIGWAIAHGIDDETARILNWKDEFITFDGRKVSAVESAMLLCDGVVSMSRMLCERYDLRNWQLFHISACLLGTLRELGASKEVMGYIAVLTLLGCRRVCSALWRISDAAAPEFARYWIRAINKHVFPGWFRRMYRTIRGRPQVSPHAFGIAFKEALDDFRRASGGRYNHEFYWAAYTLYGLG